MREKFEKLPEIKLRLLSVKFNESLCRYESINPVLIECFEAALFLNGAWYAFQEQQKKIDFLGMKLEATKCVAAKRREEVLFRDAKIDAIKKICDAYWLDNDRDYNVYIQDIEELLK